MTAAGESGVEEGVKNRLGGGDRCGGPGEAQDVGIIVFPGDAGGGFVLDQGGLDAGGAVGRDAHADAGGADEDAAVGWISQYAVEHGRDEVRVVDAGTAVSAEVVDIHSARAQGSH